MFNIVLFNPQIPPNTGNIIRLCSNTNSKIHLIKPLGFSINMKSMRRAGLDYIKNVQVKTYKDIDDFLIKTDFKNARRKSTCARPRACITSKTTNEE